MEIIQDRPRPRRRKNFSGDVQILTDRDVAVLDFLWRWKLATTSTLHEVIGRPNSPYSTFKALERMERQEFIECFWNVRRKFKTWQLTDKGFETIREDLGELKEEGFLSENHWHDCNVLAFQLGEWSTLRFPVVTHFTEQELRRRSRDYYPEWVPNTGEHRADGYTRIEGAKKAWVLAYEVELWAKSTAIYESLIRYYRMHRGLDLVYWLIGDPEVKKQILRAKTCVRDPEDNYHLFVDIGQYQAKGWDAPVTNSRSETLFTIRENTRGLLGDHYRELLGTAWGKSGVHVHYDPNKIIGKPRG